MHTRQSHVAVNVSIGYRMINNNPLTVVAGHLQFLAAEVGDRPTAQGHLERAKRAVQRITEMICHMQSITRLERLRRLDTAGLGTLDLRRSSGPAPGSGPIDGEEGTAPPRQG